MLRHRFLITVLLAVSVRGAEVSGVWSLRLMTSDGESAPRATVVQGHDRFDRAADDRRVDDARTRTRNIQGIEKPEMNHRGAH